MLEPQRTEKTDREHGFCFSGSAIWNNLPYDLRDVTDTSALNTFLSHPLNALRSKDGSRMCSYASTQQFQQRHYVLFIHPLIKSDIVTTISHKMLERF